MNIKEVKDLIRDILQSDISEFELEHTGTRVRLRRGIAPAEGSTTSVAPVYARQVTAGRETIASMAGAFAPPIAPREDMTPDEGLHYITSPIVGTFYRAPSPTVDAYVKIGAKVEVGTTLCIVEAMKLMNEIPSDAAGEVAEIYVENGHPVEFGQKLFGIRPRK
ncbi:MAG: acetyl-CoA carboxylase biotin carboxyl carrier protein [Acidobacteriota bacterium]|jgi:acetyl-CoA carboxylase biotin carboxyl carrier protein